jgi:hypothetical protein
MYTAEAVQTDAGEISTRFCTIIDHLGLSPKQLEKSIPTLTVYAQNQIRMKYKRPDSEQLEAFFRLFPQVNREWVLDGEGKKLNTENSERVTNKEILGHVTKVAGLSNLNQLSKMLNISPQQFYHIRNDKYPITKSMARRISKMFPRITMDYLLSGNQFMGVLEPDPKGLVDIKTRRHFEEQIADLNDKLNKLMDLYSKAMDTNAKLVDVIARNNLSPDLTLQNPAIQSCR